MSDAPSDQQNLNHTALNDLHHKLGARMVPFAGYSMPIQYPSGILVEHQQCRQRASLFDVSHMGQIFIPGDDADKKLEQLCAADLQELKPGRQIYTQLLNENGTIIDDLMVARANADSPYASGLMLVVNAARKKEDIEILQTVFPNQLEILQDRAMVALQGPESEQALKKINPNIEKMKFMDWQNLVLQGQDCFVARAGYTGEDGFEISFANQHAIDFVSKLLELSEVEPAGLGARDTLRLEAGLCLYGQDIDQTTTPIEAGLLWSIGKRRRVEGGFNGAETILHQIKNKCKRKLIGLNIEGRVPARNNALICNDEEQEVGRITSGGFAPSLGHAIAMAYVATSAIENPLFIAGRKGLINCNRVKMPFFPHRYKRT
ncbi:MAG: glycine cleavage system aminomethyltransferase GcvT [Pseudomonadota bacterium]